MHRWITPIELYQLNLKPKTFLVIQIRELFKLMGSWLGRSNQLWFTPSHCEGQRSGWRSNNWHYHFDTKNCVIKWDRWHCKCNVYEGSEVSVICSIKSKNFEKKKIIGLLITHVLCLTLFQKVKSLFGFTFSITYNFHHSIFITHHS